MFRDLDVQVHTAETRLRLGDLHHDGGDAAAARDFWSSGLDALAHPVHAGSSVAAGLRRWMAGGETG
jgi:hypothetical protein